jgi:hypothetical protein
MQQSINHALESQRLDSEQQLRATAEFVSNKWPLLRDEITKVVLLLLYYTAAAAAAADAAVGHPHFT